MGKPGRRAVAELVPRLREELHLDLVIANGENAADGSGITCKIYRHLIEVGVDCVTLGDHIYRRIEIESVLEKEPNIVKPANYPEGAPGKEFAIVTAANGIEVGVFSLLGRVFMKPVDCPWTAADRVLSDMPRDVKVRILDFHAEATSDKQLMARYLDGKVSAVLGTHTHVPTADECILPSGTAFQCDVGMTGPYDSILGREIDPVMRATLTFRPARFEVARKDVRLSATLLDIDPKTGMATSIERVCRVFEE